MMKKVKKQPVIILIFISIIFFGAEVSNLSADADPFYKKILQEGINFLAEGKYQEAIENFRIAEFGLLDEKEILKELYFFYSLAFLKTGKLDDALKMMKDMKNELHIDIEAVKTLSVPQTIKIDAIVLQATLFKSDGIKESDALKKIYNYEWVFWNTLKKLEDNKSEEVKRNINILEKMDKKDTMSHYIDGVFKFKKKKYKACIESLNKVILTSILIQIDPALRENLYYYLALSYHYLKDKKQSRKYYEKISDETIKSKLVKKIKK